MHWYRTESGKDHRTASEKSRGPECKGDCQCHERGEISFHIPQSPSAAGHQGKRNRYPWNAKLLRPSSVHGGAPWLMRDLVIEGRIERLGGRFGAHSVVL